MNVLLIDDEPAAITALRSLLTENFPTVEILGTAANVCEGLQQIDRLRPKLIFLDVEMPGGSGFDLLRRLPTTDRPEVIFVTSKEEYALRAIQAAALAYLVKPVDPDKLTAALQYARLRLREKQSHQRLEVLLANLDAEHSRDQRIALPGETGVEFVTVGDIVCCSGYEGYTRIYLADGSFRVSSYSIGGFQKTLADHNFCAVHRSHLVNYQHVRGYAAAGVLRMSNGMDVPVARRRKTAVEAWLEDSMAPAQR